MDKFKNLSKRILEHIQFFWPVWLIFLVCGIVSCIFAHVGCLKTSRIILYSIPTIIVLIMIIGKPLNVIYGLIGTSGNVKVFVINMLLINIVFAAIYYFAIFNGAGITYDINPQYISYGMFKDNNHVNTKVVEYEDSTYFYGLSCDTDSKEVYTITKEEHRYHRVTFWQVFQNTMLTSLIQEPTNIFSVASENVDIPYENEKDIVEYCNNGSCIIRQKDIDRNKSSVFSCLLTLQIFISWIYFGVFISILYNKFRYES